MAVAWRNNCLVLLLVASFQLTTIVSAQTNYSFDHWIEARDRWARTLAAETGTSVENAMEWMGASSFEDPENPYLELLRVRRTAEQRQVEDREQYEKDKVEATKQRGSFDEIFAEREARNRLTVAKLKKESAEHQKLKTIKHAVAAAIAIAVVVIVFGARRKIVEAVSRWWRGKRKAFRVWSFGSFFWAVGTLIFVWLDEPYGGRMDDYEVWHMLSMMIVPPLFLGAVWFGYKRFVD